MAGAGTFLPGIQKRPRKPIRCIIMPGHGFPVRERAVSLISHTLLAGVNRLHIKQAAPSISVAAGCGICTADSFPLGILFRPADNSLSSRHLTHIYLLCFCFYCTFYYTLYMKICKHFFDIFLRGLLRRFPVIGTVLQGTDGKILIIQVFQTGKGLAYDHLKLDELRLVPGHMVYTVSQTRHLLGGHPVVAVVQDMLDQIRLIQIGKDNPVHHPLHIPDGLLVSRKNQAVHILVLQLFQRVKIPLKQMLVGIGGAHNGHNAVNDLVRAKSILWFRSYSPICP